jgi:hypothetical protein
MREDQEDRRYAAIAIAIAAGVLRPCPDHSDVLLSVDGADIQDAYAYGASKWERGHLRDFFSSRRQMLASIKAAIADNQIQYCPVCDPSPPH